MQRATGQGARALCEGEFHSAYTIDELVPGFVPKPAGWGEYKDGDIDVYFFLGDFHDMDLAAAPDPAEFMSQVVELHEKGTSPTGMFGFHVATVCGNGTYCDLGKQSGGVFHPPAIGRRQVGQRNKWAVARA